MKNDCPICKKNLFTREGAGCKMCGDPIKDNGFEFCIKHCEDKNE